MARRSGNTGAAKKSLPAAQAADAVIGSVLISPSSYEEVDLVPEDFEQPWQVATWEAIQGMVAKKEQIDVITLSERLRDTHPADRIDLPEENTSWLGALSSIQRDTPTAANISTYAKIVKQRSTTRAAERIGYSLVEGGADKEPEEVVDEAVRSLMALMKTDRNYSFRIGAAIGRTIDKMEERVEGKTKVGIQTKITKLDNHLGGLAPGHLIVIGARPAMGKTTMGLQILLNNPTISSGFMSTEMPGEELVQRAAANFSEVSSHAMRLGKVSEADWPKITAAFSTIHDMPIFVNDKPGPTPFEVIRQIRRWKYENDIKIAVIDYIQHLKLRDNRDRTPQLQEAVVAFKELARDLKIPVVLLAQINRSVESRSDKRPNLGDFKDTGALEEEGDVVLSLYRDEVYNPKNIDTKGIIEIAILKNRHGPTAYLKARYNAALLRIEDYDPAATNSFE